jgi:hypothetical protein
MTVGALHKTVRGKEKLRVRKSQTGLVHQPEIAIKKEYTEPFPIFI